MSIRGMLVPLALAAACQRRSTDSVRGTLGDTRRETDETGSNRHFVRDAARSPGSCPGPSTRRVEAGMDPADRNRFWIRPLTCCTPRSRDDDQCSIARTARAIGEGDLLVFSIVLKRGSGRSQSVQTSHQVTPPSGRANERDQLMRAPSGRATRIEMAISVGEPSVTSISDSFRFSQRSVIELAGS